MVVQELAQHRLPALSPVGQLLARCVQFSETGLEKHNSLSHDWSRSLPAEALGRYSCGKS
jgi:hypothetical protein